MAGEGAAGAGGPPEGLEKGASDLRFHLTEAGVPDTVQAALFKKGFDTLRVFAGIEETRVDARQAFADELSLSPGDAGTRKTLALLLSAWESSRTQIQLAERQKLESKTSHQPRLVPTAEIHAMRAAVEAKLGDIRDAEAPSKQLIAMRLEQTEENLPMLEDLRECTSMDDQETEAFTATIDPGQGILKVRSGKQSVALPKNAEELRLRHRRIGLSWEYVATRHHHRTWLRGHITDCFRKFSDWILGGQVAGLQTADNRRPSWELVLSFEKEARSKLYKAIRDGEATDFDAALTYIKGRADVLNNHLVIPFTLNLSGREAPQWQQAIGQGAGGAKGSGKGRDKTLPAVLKKNKTRFHTKTPDGKLICFKFQKAKACPAGRACKFLHVCHKCLGQHLSS